MLVNRPDEEMCFVLLDHLSLKSLAEFRLPLECGSRLAVRLLLTIETRDMSQVKCWEVDGMGP
jgi:hypothetical protein